MISLEEIRKPILPHLEEYEKTFRNSLKSSVPLLDKVTRYIYRQKGKQMRPMFVFLCAGISGQINPSTYRAAAMIELLHTATLVHDDVVDDSNERRGYFSINALWKNKIAVLVGDYLLSRGLLLSLEGDDFQLLKIMSGAGIAADREGPPAGHRRGGLLRCDPQENRFPVIVMLCKRSRLGRSQ
jgi:octaprenyl-diphosphate synthase